MARQRKFKSATGAHSDNQPHFPPERIRKLLLGLKAALSLAEQRTVTLDDLEQLSGRPAATIGGWLDGDRLLQGEFLFALLERVPARLRHELIDVICRTQPTLQHPRIAHDPIAVSQFETLLRQTRGLTMVQGNVPHLRAFLVAALGNSLRTVARGERSVLGLNAHAPEAWAPVPGVQQQLDDEAAMLAASWPRFEAAPAGSLILLGCQHALIDKSRLAELAGRCHVVVADGLNQPLAELARRYPGPVHLVTVTPAREQPEWLRLTIQRG